MEDYARRYVEYDKIVSICRYLLLISQYHMVQDYEPLTLNYINRSLNSSLLTQDASDLSRYLSNTCLIL